MSEEATMHANIRALTLLVLPATALAQDFTQWRGPARDGRASGFQAPAAWPAELSTAWKVAVGSGHSSPVVSAGRVFVLAREGEEEVVRGIEIDSAKQLWRDAYPAPYEVNPAARGHGKGPKSTPALADGKLVTFGISGILSCYDTAKGERLWQRSFQKEFAKTSPLYGTAASPLVHRGFAIVPIGGHDGGALAAFDLSTGRDRWRWKDDGPGYGSPVLVEVAGQEQVVVQMQENLVAVDPADGKLLWKLPYKTEYHQNSITAVASGDLLIHGGYQMPLSALRVAKEANGWSAREVWQSREGRVFLSTPVLDGERLYGFSDRDKGRLYSLEARDGKTVWQGPPRSGDNAALVLAGGYLLALTTDGILRIIEIGTARYDVVREYQVSDSPIWAHPALAEGRILVKDENALTCLRIDG
jgi:outer membrane protein assembly factor BamB